MKRNDVLQRNIIGLKPCPFCGAKAEFFQTSCDAYDSSVGMYFRIRCHKCRSTRDDASGRIEVRLSLDGELNILRDDRQEAANVWNKRGEDG